MSKRSVERRLESHRAAARRQTTKPDRDEIIWFRGWKMTRYTAAALRVLEEKLGFELSIVQGPWNGDVDASAGTHNKDGVVDLAPYRAKKKCTLARRNSWAMWIRPKRPGVWGKHLHGCLLRARPMADLAKWQRDVAYPNKWSGLSGNATDTFPVHPVLEPFDYNEWWHDQLLDDRIQGVTATINKYVDKLSAARAKRKKLVAERRRSR